MFLGYAFGEKGGLEWGAEVFATHLLQERQCGEAARQYGLGPLLRFGMVELSRPQLTLAGHGGGETWDSFAIDGELGVGFPLQRERSHPVPHTGLTFEVAGAVDLYFRQTWLPAALSVGGGFRYPPLFGLGPDCGVAGSP